MVLLVLFSTFICSGLPGQNITLGILEDVPGIYADQPSSSMVRVVFRKNGDSWEAYPNDCRDQSCLRTITDKYPREIAWTIAFDGKRLTQLTGQTPKEFKYYSGVGLQEILNKANMPRIGQKSSAYSGFLETPVFRPLVAISQPYFSDEESWKPSQLTGNLAILLRRSFRTKFPKMCRSSKKDETQLEPFLYSDEDIKVVKSYASKKGWTIARLHLEGAVDCNDTEAGFEIDDPWFVVDSRRSVQYLDEGMWLVDAGDYDNDDKSELIFSIDRYNRGGYELFYDDFKKRAIFKFSYH